MSRDEDRTPAASPDEDAVRELAALRDVAVPPALVARVMTQVARPRPPTLWQWLRRPIRLELRVSPGGALALAAGALGALALVLSHRSPPPLAVMIEPPGAPPVMVRFTLDARGARHVTLAGDFNDWNTEAIAMEDSDQSGHFVATVALPPGLHQYMFLVDGEWVTDPTVSERRPDGFGRQNALLRL
ncbi:MAG TPA: glycogen-binding domain-containing protein [Polyangia bacterium]|nr:glycogen-binding domain-containing protein [Polyangia bacterium]